MDGAKDSPVEFAASHIASPAAQEAKVHFFVGDTQTHGMNPPFLGLNLDLPAAVTSLLDRVLDAEVEQFGAENVLYAMGNNDGPHSAIFMAQDNLTIAWAQSPERFGSSYRDGRPGH
jgi:hypothetical protein